VAGDILVGMMRKGGTSGYGVVFTYTPGTGALAVPHVFQGGAGDGATPYHGNLVAVGPYLYGLPYAGGEQNGGLGVILRFELQNRQMTVLHAFANGIM
jgi:hypothetical protein